MHWFVPTTDRAATLDVIVSRLDPGRPAFAIDAVHPAAATPTADGLLKTPKMEFDAASAFYTSAV